MLFCCLSSGFSCSIRFFLYLTKTRSLMNTGFKSLGRDFMRSAGIYVHIPFCVKKCNYCDFNSYAGCFDRQGEYFDALFSEILKKSGQLKDFVFDTVYIGGGTPTSVNSDYIAELMAVLR